MAKRIFVLSFLLLCSPFFIAPTPCAASGTYFDQAHGQAFLIENTGPLDLSELAAVFTEQGTDVRAHEGALTKESLEKIDSLVISGPFAPLSLAESDSIMEWLYNGGRLSLMLHIPQPASHLLRKLGVVVSYTPISEQENIIADNPKDFTVTTLAEHPITEGLSSFKVYGIWGVMNYDDNSQVISAASPHSWVDMDKDNTLGEGDGVYPYGLVVSGQVGQGEFVVFGDDAIFQNQFLTDENRQLAANLADWLQKK